MYHINTESKEELKEIIERTNLEESKTILDKMINLRGMNVLGVFMLPLLNNDFDSDIYKSWCDGVEYEKDELIKIFAHFAKANFDGEIVNSNIIELSPNFILDKAQL